MNIIESKIKFKCIITLSIRVQFQLMKDYKELIEQLILFLSTTYIAKYNTYIY